MLKVGISSFWMIHELLKRGVQIYDCKIDRHLTNTDAMTICSEADQAHKENTAVLGNAASFLKLHDKAIAEGFLKQASVMETPYSNFLPFSHF